MREGQLVHWEWFERLRFVPNDLAQYMFLWDTFCLLACLLAWRLGKGRSDPSPCALALRLSPRPVCWCETT